MPEQRQTFLAAESYRCPACHGNVSTNDNGTLHCAGCGTAFPWIGRRIPVLVNQPQHYLAGERQLIENDAAQHATTATYYSQAAETSGIRQATLREIGSGCAANSTLLQKLLTLLPEGTDSDEGLGLSLGADLFASLRKDWSGLEETEKELKVARDAICGLLDELHPERTLVLGAGAGRMLCDLDEEYSGVVGLDLSSVMAAAFSVLCDEGELQAYLLHRGNFLRGRDEAELIPARRQLAQGTPQYVVADAGELPFLGETFDAVVSNYFTDMLPLAQWLPEVRRVLTREGRLIHFGPLGYAFGEIAEHYALDQLPAAFEQYGMKMNEPQFIRNSFYGSENRLNRFELDNLLFTAQRHTV